MEPARIVVSGACGNIGYSIIPLICTGQLLGPCRPFILHLLVTEKSLKEVKGLVMEIEDGAYPLCKGVVETSDPLVGFKDIDYAVLLGGMPRTAGMERKDLIEKNVNIFKQQGIALEKVGKKTAKILVVANPCNTNCNVMRKMAPSIPKENFVAMTRLDYNRAKGQLAQKAREVVGCPCIGPQHIKNVAIWGNHSTTQYPDVNHGVIVCCTKYVPIREAIKNDEWLNTTFIKSIQTRGKTVIEARGSSSAASAAMAAVNCMRDWVLGTPEGEHVAMGVISDGNTYGVPEGLIYSFPCVCKNGEWKIVKDLPIDEFSKKMMENTTKELLEEDETAKLFI